MAFKKQLVTSCKQAIWGEILGGNAPNYANKSPFILKLICLILKSSFTLWKRTLLRKCRTAKVSYAK